MSSDLEDLNELNIRPEYIRDALDGDLDGLNNGFSWRATEQGHEYWSDIYRRSKPFKPVDRIYITNLLAKQARYRGRQYRDPVYYETVDKLGDQPTYYHDVYTIQFFSELCERGEFLDMDGYGHPVKDYLADSSIILRPANFRLFLPPEASHIVWHNS